MVDVPEMWEQPTEAELANALSVIVRALENADLARYYRVRGNYAGATFAALEPNEPNSYAASDLHAVSLLSIDVEPGATRRLLEPGPLRHDVERALRAIPVDLGLAHASSSDLYRAWWLQVALKSALASPDSESSNAWVTASKLSARKRPLLIPVRDNVVGGALGGRALSHASVFWQIMSSALRDDSVVTALAGARERRGPNSDRAQCTAIDRRRSLGHTRWHGGKQGCIRLARRLRAGTSG